MPVVTPLINGVNYSWVNITLVMFGSPVRGFLEVNWNRKQKKENNYGWGPDPISRGYGNKEPEADITLYWDEWRQIINAASDKDPNNIPMFDIQVLFGGSSVNFEQVTLQACEFVEDPFQAKQGDTKFTIKIPLIVGAIKYG